MLYVNIGVVNSWAVPKCSYLGMAIENVEKKLEIIMILPREEAVLVTDVCIARTEVSFWTPRKMSGYSSILK